MHQLDKLKAQRKATGSPENTGQGSFMSLVLVLGEKRLLKVMLTFLLNLINLVYLNMLDWNMIWQNI